jgi:hypothetical protein
VHNLSLILAEILSIFAVWHMLNYLQFSMTEFCYLHGSKFHHQDTLSMKWVIVVLQFSHGIFAFVGVVEKQ